MKEDPKSSPTIRQHLASVAGSIDAHLNEPFAHGLNREFEGRCCAACRARLDGPLPGDIGDPMDQARRLMLEAAKTRHCVPSPERWRVDSELKPSLRERFYHYANGLLGPCTAQPAADADAPEGIVGVVMVGVTKEGTLWWELTKDGTFIDRINQAYEPYRGRVSFEQFRAGLLRACVTRGTKDVNGALSVLQELTKDFAAEWLN